RPISATHEAHGSLRVMPPCFATGQAAGTAAALALETGVLPRGIDVTLLQRSLEQQGALI
ncbi:MAG: FAD-dependent oxidoreductase, partial [Anaerolineae bacterium]